MQYIVHNPSPYYFSGGFRPYTTKLYTVVSDGWCGRLAEKKHSLLAVLMVVPVLDVSSKIDHNEFSLVFGPAKYLLKSS
jgi:hypothetical protein